MPNPPARRPLQFKTLEDVVVDTESLITRGYRPVGKWNLAQVCGHLSEWLRYPIDGFPPSPMAFRVILWTMRKTVGRKMLARTLETGTMPAGAPTIPVSVPQNAGDDRTAVQKLRETVARYQSHAGPWHPSPLYGVMTDDERTRLQLVHCAHHLSFLIPDAPNA